MKIKVHNLSVCKIIVRQLLIETVQCYGFESYLMYANTFVQIFVIFNDDTCFFSLFVCDYNILGYLSSDVLIR